MNYNIQVPDRRCFQVINFVDPVTQYEFVNKANP